mgnify:FL=1
MTKDVTLQFNYVGTVEQDWEGKKMNIAGFEGKTVINRIDFGVGESGMASDDVRIAITLEAVQPKK